MFHKRVVTFAFVLTLPLTAIGEEPKDAEGINGTWSMETAELAGKAFPEKIRQSIKLEIKGGEYSVTSGEVVDRGTVKVNAAPTPKELDIVGTDGPNKGKTILAIYELNGDTLKVCYDLGGKARPTEFASKEGTPLFLVSYKREKP